MAKLRVILRTDAGEELGRFRTIHEARDFAKTLPQAYRDMVLVIQSDGGIVMARRWPTEGK